MVWSYYPRLQSLFLCHGLTDGTVHDQSYFPSFRFSIQSSALRDHKDAQCLLASFGRPSAASFCNCRRIAAPGPASSQGQEGQMEKHKIARTNSNNRIYKVLRSFIWKRNQKNRQASQHQKLMASKLTFKQLSTGMLFWAIVISSTKRNKKCIVVRHSPK